MRWEFLTYFYEIQPNLRILERKNHPITYIEGNLWRCASVVNSENSVVNSESEFEPDRYITSTFELIHLVKVWTPYPRLWVR